MPLISAGVNVMSVVMMFSSFHGYGLFYLGRNFVSAETSSVDLSKESSGAEEDKDKEKKDGEKEEDGKDGEEDKKKDDASAAVVGLDDSKAAVLCSWLKASLGEARVREVKTTDRLSDSPAIVTDHESGALRRMMKMLVRTSTCIHIYDYATIRHFIYYGLIYRILYILYNIAQYPGRTKPMVGAAPCPCLRRSLRSTHSMKSTCSCWRPSRRAGRTSPRSSPSNASTMHSLLRD